MSDTITTNTGPLVWSVIDSDNFECGGIHSLHWTAQGACAEALKLVEQEDVNCLEETGKRMTLVGPYEWNWTHRTIKVELAKVQP